VEHALSTFWCTKPKASREAVAKGVDKIDMVFLIDLMTLPLVVLTVFASHCVTQSKLPTCIGWMAWHGFPNIFYVVYFIFYIYIIYAWLIQCAFLSTPKTTVKSCLATAHNLDRSGGEWTQHWWAKERGRLREREHIYCGYWKLPAHHVAALGNCQPSRGGSSVLGLRPADPLIHAACSYPNLHICIHPCL